MSPEQRENVQSIIDKLEDIGDKIGGWTSKLNARQTGLTLYITFDKKVDVWVTAEFAGYLEQAPAMLNDACRKLLVADAAAAVATRSEP